MFEVAIDADSAGNTATSLGELNTCRSLTVNETFTVDVVVPNLVEPGLGGFGANVVYDPTVLRVLAYNKDMMVAANPSYVPWSSIDPMPDVDGNFRFDFADISGLTGEQGEGILIRITFEALGEGVTILDLTDTTASGQVLLVAPTGAEYPLSYIRDAEIVVGGSCPGLLSDSDQDSFKDAREDYVGTDPADRCADDTILNNERGPAFAEPLSPWPPDFDDNRSTNIIDVILLGPAFNTSPPNPAYNARFDLDAGNNVNIIDVIAMGPFFNRVCTP